MRSDFLKENEEAVKLFIEDHKASAAYTSEHLDEAAEMVAALGIVEKGTDCEKGYAGLQHCVHHRGRNEVCALRLFICSGSC